MGTFVCPLLLKIVIDFVTAPGRVSEIKGSFNLLSGKADLVRFMI